MTGPEAYEEAQEHLENAAKHYDRGEALAMQYELGTGLISGLLALAAAAALAGQGEGGWALPADRAAWIRTASEVPAETRRQREAEAAEFAQEAQS